jgi:EcsC protein family
MMDATMALSAEDRAALREAVRALEHPGFAARLASVIGQPVERAGRALPPAAAEAIASVTTKALNAALSVALTTLRGAPAGSRRLHTALAAASGAAGGAFGLVSLPIELPISTVIMLRSIAEIARRAGEDLTTPDAALACIQVFALGARNANSEGGESGYFAVRSILAKTVSEAARYIAERGILEEGAPVLVRLLSLVSARFGVVVTQKLAAQAIPVIGAVGGAAVNYAFIEHFQDTAAGHFTIRRLERIHGKETVRDEYERLRASEAA